MTDAGCKSGWCKELPRRHRDAERIAKMEMGARAKPGPRNALGGEMARWYYSRGEAVATEAQNGAAKARPPALSDQMDVFAFHDTAISF